MPIQIIITPEEHPLDPVGWQDWLTVSLVCTTTLVLLVGCYLVFRLQRHYPPLRARHWAKLLGMSIFGLLQVWVTLVANNHLGNSWDYKAASCVFVNYWLEYVLGLNGWMILLLLGLLDHGAVFHPQLRQLSVRQLRRRQQLVVLLLSAPVCLIAIVITWTPGAVYFAEGTCHTQTWYKLVLALWVLGSCVVILAFNRYLGKTQTEGAHKFFNEYAALRDVGQYGVLVLAINGTIAVAGLLNYATARLLFTGLLACLHSYTFLRLYGMRLLRALRKDERYARRFLSTASVYGKRLAHVSDLVIFPSLLEEFFSFCQEQDRSQDDQARRLPQLWIQCESWRVSADVRSLDTLHMVTNQYLSSAGAFFVHPPTSLAIAVSQRNTVDAEALVDVASFVLQRMEDLWGAAFFDSLAMDRRIAQMTSGELQNFLHSQNDAWEVIGEGDAVATSIPIVMQDL